MASWVSLGCQRKCDSTHRRLGESFCLLGYRGFVSCFLAHPSDISIREPRGDSLTPIRIGWWWRRVGFESSMLPFVVPRAGPHLSLVISVLSGWLIGVGVYLRHGGLFPQGVGCLHSATWFVPVCTWVCINPPKEQQHLRPVCLLIPWNEKKSDAK